ncbi:G protein-regulated inducer of neurite outgrowth 1 [Phyllopteryx taeniolatus]|uniref:G protein-regulated inducer of neurite outgrowth 1 n=1 Tax=Phyllopteryx taeniolatus TaxID=161469 RepID=UPI002AD23638|nr:G protein-regulated inducer of neurite outgrowth 1 [Phyllopteryx taeniolatus]XP_061612210.1 G protein-regulated inducer of neurite outgrowth 1 [Phyllopteryx taeniolatus]
MAMRPVRPASEIYPSVCCSVSPSVSYSSLTVMEGPEDDGEPHTPIFSISKSSMDVFKRDPVWTAVDLRRSSSVNVEQGPLQQLHGWRRVGSLQSPDPHNSPALSERWVANMRRWSRCSGGSGAHSRSSTPDTVVWGGGTSRPCSLARDAPCCAAPASPTTHASSPFISPLLTPTMPSVDLCTSSPVSPLPSPTVLFPEQGDSEGSPLTSTTPPLKPFFRVTSTENDAYPGNRLLYFQYPSPMASSVCSEEGASLSPGGLTEEETAPMSDPRARVTSSADEDQEPDEGASVCHLQLPWQPQPRRPPLVSSLSDSLLGEGCRWSRGGLQREPFFKAKARREVVDAAVQTLSPAGSWLDLRRNTSHSPLGSPPGSKLELKASVGSNSNLVSTSSSMFPTGEDEEEEGKPKDVLERRRSSLKAGEEKKELGERRRSSMKQVQWDEDGMTWDVHGMSVEPEVLSTAIRKHLELHNSPQAGKRPSKKKTKAPKPHAPPASPPAALPDVTPPTRDGGGKTEEAPREASRAEGGEAGNDGISKSPSLSRGTIRKRSVMKSLRPGWCGGLKKEDD